MKLAHLILLSSLVLLAAACGKSASTSAPEGTAHNPADGPASIVIPANLTELIAKTDAKAGEAVFATKGCKACHNLTDVKLVGPGLKGVGGRRSVPWMARMILKPEIMVKEDPEAKKLLAAMMTPMANQNVAAETELPALLAFLASL